MGFTIRRSEVDRVRAALHDLATAFGGGAHFDENVGKVSVVGMGLLSRPEYTARVMAALAGAEIPTSWISTSQSRMSVIVPRDRTVAAVDALHRAFGLDRADGQPDGFEADGFEADGFEADGFEAGGL
jgi:aspartate kinase